MAVSLETTRAVPVEPFRLLLVCDNDAVRLLVRASFHLVDIGLVEASSVRDARRHVAARPPDLIILDADLRGASAFAEAASAPVLVLERPGEPFDLLGAAAALAPELYAAPSASVELATNEKLLLANFDLRRLVERERTLREAEQHRCQAETVGALLRALLLRDQATAAHCRRVQRYAHELARECAPNLLDDPTLLPGFLLHDIGKLVIPERLLTKPGPLTPSERAVMEQHAVLGEALLGGVSALAGSGLEVIRSHHERWDGAGYPDSLTAEAIPLSARIFAVVDALDALTTDRPYRRARGWNDAVAEIEEGSGSHFDPSVVEALVRIEPRLRRVMRPTPTPKVLEAVR